MQLLHGNDFQSLARSYENCRFVKMFRKSTLLDWSGGLFEKFSFVCVF